MVILIKIWQINLEKKFDDKILSIVSNFQGGLVTNPNYLPDIPYVGLLTFSDISNEELKDLVKNMKVTHCTNDPMPFSDIINVDSFSELLQFILCIVNLSIQQCVFPQSEKLGIVRPTLKNKLDPQSLSSYRPVSNLSFLEKVILDQLLEYFQLFRPYLINNLPIGNYIVQNLLRVV